MEWVESSDCFAKFPRGRHAIAKLEGPLKLGWLGGIEDFDLRGNGMLAWSTCSRFHLPTAIAADPRRAHDRMTLMQSGNLHIFLLAARETVDRFPDLFAG
jgi:hypothetical protein